MTEPVLDGTAIDRLNRIGGPMLTRQMIGMFLENGRDRVASAEAACMDADPSGVELAAHSLRSSAGNVGARRLQLAAGAAEDAAETAAEAGMSPQIEQLVREMRAEYTAAAAALNGLLLELDS